MIFTLADVILVVIFFAFVFGGFALGLIRSVGALVGLALGVWVAGHYFMGPADWLAPIIGGNGSLAKIISFVVIFLIINQCVTLIFHLLDKAFNLLYIIPFVSSLNRLGGVILGAIEGVLTLGVIIYIIAKFAPESGFVTGTLDKSQIAHYLVFGSQWLINILPEAFAKIKSVF